MMISTHVLDIARGRPAGHIPVELDFFITGQGWREVGRGVTTQEGRIDDFGEPAAPGVYRMMFDIASYLSETLFPSVTITFEVRHADQRYHLPLLLSPYGYSTYRG
jgi:5-hydroxyisourate hydrolase